MAPTHQHSGFAPDLESYLNSELPLDVSIETAVTLLKRRQIYGAENCALAVAHVLSQVVSKSKWTTVYQLLDRVCQVGRKLADAQPQELVIGNIVRRVMGLIQDEAEEDRTENGNHDLGMTDSISDLRTAASTVVATASSSPTRASATSHSSFMASPPRLVRQSSLLPSSSSMFNLLSAVERSASVSGDTSANISGAATPLLRSLSSQGQGPGPIQVPIQNPTLNHNLNQNQGQGRPTALRDEIVDGIDEIKDEIGQADDQIAGFAEGQIRPGDYVMVYAPSRTVEKFLIKAATRRRYTLFLVHGSSSSSTASEGSERYASLLKRLAAAKISVIQVDSSAVASYMPRTNRVVLDARAIAADGGVLVNCGGGRAARAARAQGCTVLVVGGVYKVSPEPWTDPEALVEWGNPSKLARFADGSLVDGIDVEIALTEYIPPALIDIYVTNLGPHSKHYLESVIADHYKSEEDLEFYGH